MAKLTQDRVIMGILAMVALIARWLPGARTVDDAFITFRYSRNIVDGVGFVYNAGERIQGTTTPLYTTIMALMGLLFGSDYPNFAVFINGIAGAVEVIFIFWIAQHLSQRRSVAIWIASVWALAPHSVTFAIGGMETSVHNMMMLGAWWAFLSDRQRWLGAFCALGVLTRPDALLWALPTLGYQLFASLAASSDRPLWRRIPLQTWMTGLVIYLPWFLFAAWYFGNPIPQTVSTKAVVYDLPAMQGLSVFLPHYASPFQAQFIFTQAAYWVGVFLFPFLALIGLRSTFNHERRALPIFIYPWVYIALFIVLNPLIFRWYLSPPTPAYLLAIGCGVAALVQFLPTIHQDRFILGLAGISLIFSLSAWEITPEHGPERPAPQMAFHDLELNYQRMATLLREDYGLTDDDRLAAGDIGAIGFYSRAEIYDTIGLVTEGTLPYYEDDEYLRSIRADDSNYVVPPQQILDAQPDFVVLMESFIRLGLLQNETFLAEYEQIAFFPTDYYGAGMMAFRRIPVTE